jgi:hypothetical protein
MLASLALAAALAAPQTVAQTTAYTSNSPIQVASCDVSTSPATAGIAGFSNIQVPTGTSFSISFVNHAPVVAKSITFDVNGTPVVDAGTFSSGVTINHQFVDPGLVGQSDATCSVQSIAFADGSVWQAQ